MTHFDYRNIANLDYFDSRDVAERIDHLNERIENHRDMFTSRDLAEVRLERLILWTILDKLSDDFPPSKWSDVRTDVNCGVQGFADHYAEEYAEEFASDIGVNSSDATWPLNHIDWQAAAEDLKNDYAEVEILGAAFYLRD